MRKGKSANAGVSTCANAGVSSGSGVNARENMGVSSSSSASMCQSTGSSASTCESIGTGSGVGARENMSAGSGVGAAINPQPSKRRRSTATNSQPSKRGRSAFLKDFTRSVSHSWGRFAAIAAIVALGTGFFAGLQMTSPDMNRSADIYYDATALYDIRVLSTYGLTDADLNTLRAVEGVSAVMPAYELDAMSLVDGEQVLMRVHSFNVEAAKASDTSSGKAAISTDEDYINRLVLVEGSWPSAANECVVGADPVLGCELAIGDVIELGEATQDLEDALVTSTYTIVGFVDASYYTSSSSLGTTSLGSGEIDQYMYVSTESFSADQPYTEAFIAVEGAVDEFATSDAYQSCVDEVAARIEALLPTLQVRRLSEVKQDAQDELDDAKAEYDEERESAEEELASAKEELDDAKSQLDDAAAELAEAKDTLASADATIASAKEELASGWESYEAGVSELEAAEAEAYEQLDAAQALIDAQRAALLAAAGSAASGAGSGSGDDSSYSASYSASDNSSGDTSSTSSANASNASDNSNASDTSNNSDNSDASDTSNNSNNSSNNTSDDSASDPAALYAAALAELDAAQQALDEQRATAEAEFAAAWEALNSAAASLSAAEAELATAEADYTSGLASYESGLAEYEEGMQSYLDGMAEYEEAYDEAMTALNDALAEIEEAQADIDALEEPTYYVLDRNKNIGAVSYEADSTRIAQIASVFPLIFFVVAALVALTTMTRMVEDERVLIGTYKALGYGSLRISGKYLAYAGLASGIGSVLGVAVFSQLLPIVIMSAYGIIYTMPVMSTTIDAGYALLSVLLGVGITLFATAAAALATLRETPASLMRPRAPKAGKRILLERIGPLWRRTSFSWKVTFRNIFRYKKRLFMTLIGIAGCTALLLTGLGLSNAINDIIDKQYGEIYHYNVTIGINDDPTDEDMEVVSAILDDDELVKSYAFAQTQAMTATVPVSSAEGTSSTNEQLVSVVVPEDAETFQSFITMRERIGGAALELTDNAVIVSEKLATELGIGVGDDMFLSVQDAVGNATDEGFTVTITGVMENYVSQYVFMTAETYAQVAGSEPEFDTIYAQATEDETARATMSDTLLALDSIATVGFNDETIDSYQRMLDTVNSVVIILVLAAAALAYIVLYNLTNINIAERQREIATLKVLGFTPREVDSYVFREIILLSMLGAAIGLVLGVYMENFVVVTAEVDQVMFGRSIHVMSFAIAFVLTLVFSAVVALFMRRKLTVIDMVESLKSNE